MVAAPTGVTGAGPFYLYVKIDLTGCYSPASAPVTTTQTLCPLSTCTDMPDIWAAPGSTLNVNGVNVTLSQGFVGTAGGSLPGQGSQAAGFLNTSAIGTTNSSTVDGNTNNWVNYIWIKLHFDQPTTLQSPFKFLDLDGFNGTNAEVATIIGQNGSTIVNPTITNGSSVTPVTMATANDPSGITLGSVTGYRSNGNYESVTDDPRNLIVADFSAQPVTDVYFMYGVYSGASGNTGAQYSAISSTCLEMAIPPANSACTSPPYKLYKYNRVSTGWASNLPVEIVGATTTNVTLDESTNATDLNFEGVDWKLVASDIVPNANGEINVTLKPVVGTTNGGFIVADAMMLSNGFTNTIIDAGNLDFSTTGAGWNSQNFAGSFLGDEVFLASNSYNGRTATWSFKDLQTTITPPTPQLLSSSIGNTCPSITYNLTTLNPADALPTGYSYQWHTGTPSTGANLISDPTAASGNGPFYLSIDGPSGCYSSSSTPVQPVFTDCSCTPTEQITNGAFDAGTGTGWTFTPTTGAWAPNATYGASISTDNTTRVTVAQNVKICQMLSQNLTVDFDMRLRNGQGGTSGQTSLFDVYWAGTKYMTVTTGNANNNIYTVDYFGGATGSIPAGTYNNATTPIPISTTTTPPTTTGHVKLIIPVGATIGQGLTGDLEFGFQAVGGTAAAHDDVFFDNVSVLGGNCLSAGPDVANVCQNGTATLNGTSIGTNTTNWAPVAGNPGTATISSPNTPTTDISGFSAPGTYKFSYSNGTCLDEATITVNPLPDAGPDQRGLSKCNGHTCRRRYRYLDSSFNSCQPKCSSNYHAYKPNLNYYRPYF